MNLLLQTQMQIFLQNQPIMFPTAYTHGTANHLSQAARRRSRSVSAGHGYPEVPQFVS